MPRFEDTHIRLGNYGTLIARVTSTPASNGCLCEIAGVETTVRIIAGVTVALGDTVLIIKHGSSRFIVGVLASAPISDPIHNPSTPEPPPSDPSPIPKPVVRSGMLICAPVQTATYRDGKWRNDLGAPINSADMLQGRWPGYGRNTGCAFYGTKPRSLSGATIIKATLHVKRLMAGQFAAQRPTLVLISQTTRPVGGPTLNETTPGPSLAVTKSTNSFTIPTSWGQAIVNGTRGGIGVNVASDKPYMKFAGRSSWSAAWVLTLSWRR